MKITYQKLALGVAFSPTAEAMLAETARLARSFRAELLLIHVGTKSPENEQRLVALLESSDLDPQKVTVVWESGDPARVILDCCKKHGVDLLVTGALKTENLVQYYVGSVARRVLRQAKCSVFTIVNPSKEARRFRNIVVNAEDSSFIEEAIATACQLSPKDNGTWVHIVRELKLYGLTMSANDQYTEEEYDDVRQGLVKQEVDQVEELLRSIPHDGIRINIKMVSGKSGFELPKFAERKEADLLVVGAPPRKLHIFDRLFPHDLEYIFADLPCNLLVVRPSKYRQTGKEAVRG